MLSNISLSSEGAVILIWVDSSAVSNRSREQLSGCNSGNKTVTKHLIRQRTAMQGAVKITDSTCERKLNTDLHQNHDA